MENFKIIRELVASKSKVYRAEKKHSQEQAEAECGLNFSRMESMTHDPRLTSLVTLANYGSRSMDEVMQRIEGKKIIIIIPVRNKI